MHSVAQGSKAQLKATGTGGLIESYHLLADQRT